MKKIVAAVSAGVLLIASQAVAAGATTDARVADRVGARAGDSSEFVGMDVPTVVIVAGAWALTGIIIASVTDDSDSN